MTDIPQIKRGSLLFVWDEDKALANWRKHRVTFEAAIEVFFDEHAVDQAVDQLDISHSNEEPRRIVIGAARDSAAGYEILFVVYAERVSQNEDVIRIISARPANRKEAKIYERGLSR